MKHAQCAKYQLCIVGGSGESQKIRWGGGGKDNGADGPSASPILGDYDQAL